MEVENSSRKVGLVKAAINMYGGSALKRTQLGSSEYQQGMPSKAKELHIARKSITEIRENKKAAESVKAQAESELLKAKRTVKEVASKIEQSSTKIQEQKRQLNKLSKARTAGNQQKYAPPAKELVNHDYQYAAVISELEAMKQELLNLKLDIERALQQKVQAENKFEIFSSKMKSYNVSAEYLTKQIEEANEEQVLVELACIEAVKELEAIQAQRNEDADKFSTMMENKRKRLSMLAEEIDRAKEAESTLAVVNSEVDVLQNELTLVKELERRVIAHNKQDELIQETSTASQSDIEELETAKREIDSRKQEGFHCMAAMDLVRKEINRILDEIDKMKKVEEKTEKVIARLNSKLLRAKNKAESVAASEEKTKAIVSSLSDSLDQLKEETKGAQEEKNMVEEEIAQIKKEIQEAEAQTDSVEDNLQAAMQELEKVKVSEEMALDQLQALAENTLRIREAAAEKSSTITISKFEYQYLKGSAAMAKETAEKKTAAAVAWTQSLKNSNKEMLMKLERAREDKQLRSKADQETYLGGKMSNEKQVEVVQGDIQIPNKRPKQKKSFTSENAPVKSMKDNNATGNYIQSSQTKFQKSASPAAKRTGRTTSITLRRKKKARVAEALKALIASRVQGYKPQLF